MKLLALLITFSVTRLLAALPATTVLEVRTTGSDLNGGGFVPGTVGGVDYSQRDTPIFSVTDAVTTTGGASNIVSCPTGTLQADFVGNICFMEGGTFPLGKSWW